ncbi:MAG: hypothetical protein LBS19_11085 [Clostridiales bacterium]|jgi:hypothetical protein|nr:hypothetical protein [Clostridiales bacterium]
MKKTFITAALLCCALIFLTSGCVSRLDDGLLEYTLEDRNRHNTVDAIFERYGSVRCEAAYYDYLIEGEQTEVYTETATYLKSGGGYSVYYETRVDGGTPEAIAIEDAGNLFYMDTDGNYMVYGFFDDGYFEESYRVSGSDWIAFWPIEGEEITRTALQGGVLNVEIRYPASIYEEYMGEGFEDYVGECRLEIDAETGLILRARDYIVSSEGESRMTGEVTMFYGEDGDFAVPEFVGHIKDMPETRTVYCVMNPGGEAEETFTFTLPKDAAFFPAPNPEGEYGVFTNAECTELYDMSPQGEYPDEMTLYLKAGGN